MTVIILFVTKRLIYIISLLLFLVSCTSTKNTRGTRFYHSVNTRYNIHFNGNEAFKDALKSQNKGYQESYSDIILMYPVSSLPKEKAEIGGPFDRAIEKSAKAIKQHSIKEKPQKKAGKSNDAEYQRYLRRTEYNPFLYKAWLLMGRSQFHNGDFLTASTTFSYITRHYVNDKPEIVYEAKIWQARSYAEMEWFYEAENILTSVNNENLPSKLNNLFSSVYADFLIKKKQYDEAIPYLTVAIRGEKDKTQRNRMKYLLGQVYQLQGNNDMAYKYFNEVAGSTAPYPLTFSAQIRQTEIHSGSTNNQKMIKKLRRMAKSSKNKDYLDQVYYALGNLYLSVPDTISAIESYQLGVEKSTQSGMDKALCQIQLGDLHFQLKNYVEAQPAYSDALGIIPKEHKDYNRVAIRSEILDELAVNHEAVVLQDSLQRLAAMSEDERMAVIEKIIEEVKIAEKKAMEDANREEFLARREEFVPDNMFDAGISPQGPSFPIAQGDNSFYFYNQQTVTVGRNAFQSKWGRRKLEDNWRRRNKVSSEFDDTFSNETEALAQEETLTESPSMEGESTDSISAPAELSTDNKDPQFYLQQIPLTEEDIEASHTIIRDGLFNMGIIYKDKLEDMNLAIETFGRLNTQYPENEFLLDAYYHLYLVYLRLGDQEMVNLYKAKIRETFPESDYAIAMADPNYEENVRMMDIVQDSIYEATYNAYLENDIPTVRDNFDLVRVKYAQSKLMPQFMFVNALSYIHSDNQDDFKDLLKELVEKYPEAEVSILAGDILKGLLSGRQLSADSAPMKGLIFNLRFGLGDGEAANDSTLTFSEEINTPHLMMLIYPTGTVNENLLLYNVAAYNFGNFMVKEFDLKLETFASISMLQIQGFSNYEEIKQYLQMIYERDGFAGGLSPQTIVMPISTDNYDVLMKGKSIEEYIAFFETHWKDGNEAMIDHWKQQREDEIRKAEEEPEEVIKPQELLQEEEPKEDIISTEEDVIVFPADTLPTIAAAPSVEADTLYQPGVTEQQLEESVSDAAEFVSEKMMKLNDAIDEFANDPLRGIINLFSRKKKEKNAIDEYVEQQEKEEKERQKALREQQRQKAKERWELQKQQEKEQKERLKQKKEEEKALQKAQKEEEKRLKQQKKDEEKQKQDEKKRIAKEKEELRKQKEDDAKLRKKQRDEERKEKERIRKEEAKRKAEERKAREKQREAERKAKNNTK